MSHPFRRSAGFTLIELLVVIAIIGVLIALLIPAVQKIRESANRTTCQNNLRQLGLACHNYEHSNGTFPPAKVSPSSPNPTLGRERSIFVFLLPYIEQDNLYRAYDISKPWFDNTNAIPGGGPIYRQPVKTFQCPSARNPRTDMIGVTTGIATSDYNVMSNVDINDPGSAYQLGLIPISLTNNSRRALLENDTGARFTDCVDGLSSTFLLVEDAGRPEMWRAGRLASSRPTGAGWADDAGQFSLHGFSWDGQTQGGPGAVNCCNGNEIYAFHSEGANVVFGDASVHFLRKSLAIDIAAALVTRAAGEVIDASKY